MSFPYGHIYIVCVYVLYICAHMSVCVAPNDCIHITYILFMGLIVVGNTMCKDTLTYYVQMLDPLYHQG